MLAIAAAAGCSTQQKIVYDPENTRPILGDDAIALRGDWPRAVSQYQNGDVAAWSTRFPYEPKMTAPERNHLLVDPAMFVVQTILLPAELIANPPGQPQVWYGVKYRPTYTAQPPLPPPGGAPARGTAYVPGGGAPAAGQTTGGPVGGPPGPPGSVAPPAMAPGTAGPAAPGAGGGR